MFFAPVIRRPAFRPVDRSFDRWFADSFAAPVARGYTVEQDEKAFTLQFDLPGLAKEHLSIGIEGSVVRIDTVADAPRQVKAAYELPQDIDVAGSEAKMEHGVLTLKLAKKVPVSNITTLAIN